MEIIDKLTAWDSQMADLIARRDDLWARQAAVESAYLEQKAKLEAEQQQLEAEFVMVSPLELVLADELNSIAKQRTGIVAEPPTITPVTEMDKV